MTKQLEIIKANKSIRFIHICFFVWFLFFCPLFIFGQSWQNVGVSPNCYTMDIQSNGNVYTTDLNINGNVLKFNGTTWTDVGNPWIGAGSYSSTYYKDISVSNSGEVYATYHYGTIVPPTPYPTGIRSYVSVYNGSAWSLLGGGSMSSMETHFPVYDAVTGYGADIDVVSKVVHIKKVITGFWNTVASIPVSTSSGYYNMAIDHDGSGNAYLIFNDGGIKLYKINASGVTKLGNNLSIGSYLGGYKIPFCITPAGTPYFGYYKTVATTKKIIVIGKFNGSNWDFIESDTLNSITGLNGNLSIEATSSGVIFASYQQAATTKIVYYTGIGTKWNDVGSQNFSGVHNIKLSTGNILYFNGCSKYDVSALSMTSPILTITNPAAVCFGKTVDLTAASITSGSTPELNYTYWTDQLATIPLVNPTAVNTSNTYYIKGVTGFNSIIQPVIVTVNSAIDVSTSVNGTTISAGEINATYKWLDCNSTNSEILGETNQSYSPSLNGSYSVVLTSAGCADTSECVTISVTAILESDVSKSFQVYPNPTHGVFSIKAASEGTYRIVNELGTTVKTVILNKQNDYSLTLENIPNGVYTIVGNEDKTLLSQKIVVLK